MMGYDYMKTTLKTTGMMCNNCETRVSKAVMGIDGVLSCIADAKSGDVIIEYTDSDAVQKAKVIIHDIGYEIL
jgi:copper chaperone CopZ